MTTERFRRNAIASLKLDDGEIVTDHSQMAGLFLQDLKNRMATFEGITMGFNLQQLLQPVEGLEDLSKPF